MFLWSHHVLSDSQSRTLVYSHLGGQGCTGSFLGLLWTDFDALSYAPLRLISMMPFLLSPLRLISMMPWVNLFLTNIGLFSGVFVGRLRILSQCIYLPMIQYQKHCLSHRLRTYSMVRDDTGWVLRMYVHARRAYIKTICIVIRMPFCAPRVSGNKYVSHKPPPPLHH